MKNKSFFGIILFIFIIFVSLNCSSPGTTNVTIHLNLGLNKANAVNTFENSIFDRIFRLFAKDVEAQSAPTHLTTLVLNVTGSGMDAIHQTYTQPFPDSISLEVPSGDSRLFEVLAYTSSATLRGAVTQNLTGGTTVEIPISMALYETKIVIPDYLDNYRIVQVDKDFSASSWQERDAAGLGIETPPVSLAQLRPYDIDFDNIGRIYITNYDSTDNAIIRVDSIDGGDPARFTPLVMLPTAIAIDRNNSLIYYANDSSILSCNLDGTNHQDLTSYFSTRVFTYIRGLAIDTSGNLYIACYFTDGGVPYSGVLKYDPSSHAIISNTTDFSDANDRPWDVVVKGNYLYVANYNESVTANRKVMQLTLNLGFNAQLITDGTNTFNDHGPHRFVAILNSRFYLIDEAEYSPTDIERIVAFDDFSSAWTEFYPGMIGQTAFQFYSPC